MKALSKAARNLNTKETAQTAPIPGREKDMARNAAGGYAFTLDRWKVLDRFLILGTEGGTCYIKEQKLTEDNVKNLRQLIDLDGVTVVKRAVEISHEGRAHSNDPALFALAMAISYGSDEVKRAAAEALPKVARIGTHLFTFVEYATNMRGWGRTLRTAVANWYKGLPSQKRAYQVTKYAQRNGWSHLDLLRLSRPLNLKDEGERVFYDFVNGKRIPDFIDIDEGHEYLQAVQAVKSIEFSKGNVKEVVKLIEKHNLPREVIPTEFLQDAAIWSALTDKMPLNALIRNLGNLTKYGVLNSKAKLEGVLERLSDEEAVRNARVHPFGVLLALRTYASGGGFRGSGAWRPIPRLKDALDDLYYASFRGVEPTGKRFLIGIDVSGSMSWSGMGSVVSAAEVAAALGMLVARTERDYDIHGFTDRFVDLGITANMSMEDVLKKTRRANFGATDCSLPMLHATKNKIEDVDVFVTVTDNETWAGRAHPIQALNEYRRKFNPNAKMLVIGVTATSFSIADPRDPGTLDVVGFDASLGSLIANFAKM